MSRTTDEWAALLDGTTPGPWGLSGSSSVVGIAIDLYDGTEMERRNVALAAAAPDAVAEVVRLRRAITDLRDDYLAHIADYDEATVTHMCYGTAADDLDRILNGDTDDPA